MRVMLVHPNYHSGGAEIAGTWPPAWAPYLAGALRKRGYHDIVFVDAMTDHLDDAAVAERIRAVQPDVIGVTAITPSIYKAERVLEIAREVHPSALRVLGGVHATFMFQQVLSEAPWIDAIVRGEGEEIFAALVRVVAEGRWVEQRRSIAGLAFRDGDEIVATPAAPKVKDLDSIEADWSILSWDKCRSACVSRSRAWRGAAPSPARSVRSGSSGETTGSAIRSVSSTRSSAWSRTTKWGSSSSRTRSRPSTRRSSSPSARSSSRAACPIA
jgi:hypothetical protein